MSDTIHNPSRVAKAERKRQRTQRRDEYIAALERELVEARRIADNLALLCYASGCGIGTKTMNEYEAMKQSAAPAAKRTVGNDSTRY